MSYFKDFRNIPEYIEVLILEQVFNNLNIKSNHLIQIEDYLDALPEEFICKTIIDINTMFGKYKKANYKSSYLSYLIYYLPANIFKTWKPLLDLHLKSLLKANLEILDIGTGPGSIPIGIIEFYKHLAITYKHIEFSLNFTLIEIEKNFIDIAIKLINDTNKYLPHNLKVNIRNTYNERVGENYENKNLEKYDLITMSNFLNINEYNNSCIAVNILNGLKKNLAENGALILIENGDMQNCVEFKGIRNEVVNNKTYNIYSPCVGIWEEKEKYTCRCISMTRVYLKQPKIYQFLYSRGVEKANNIDIPFNYVILRTDGLRKYEIETNRQNYSKLCELKEKNNEIVHVAAIIRTVIPNKKNRSDIRLLLCDNSFDSGSIKYDVNIELTKEQLFKHGITIPLIAAEKIALKNVAVKIRTKNNIYLEVLPNSRITVEY